MIKMVKGISEKATSENYGMFVQCPDMPPLYLKETEENYVHAHLKE